MKHPQKFPRILALDFFGIASLYLLFGFVGYLAFGNKTQNIITLNLLQDLSTILVKLGLCIGLFFTYPFMMYPVHEIFEGKLMRSAWFQTIAPPSSHLHILLRNGVRGASVIGTAVLAVSAPGFAIFISLVGGTVCALLAFVLPSLFHMQLCAGSSSMQSRIADMVLTLCGITFAAYSIYTTVVSIFMTPSWRQVATGSVGLQTSNRSTQQAREPEIPTWIRLGSCKPWFDDRSETFKF